MGICRALLLLLVCSVGALGSLNRVQYTIHAAKLQQPMQPTVIQVTQAKPEVEYNTELLATEQRELSNEKESDTHATTTCLVSKLLQTRTTGVVVLSKTHRTADEKRKFFKHLANQRSKSEEAEPISLELTSHSGGENRHFTSKYYVPLNNLYNSQYLGRIHVGTPEQPFNVIFDTGSCLLWIDGDECQSKSCKDGKHNTFAAKRSSTFLELETEMVVTFGTGEIEGFLAKDTFTLGGVKVPDQGFGVITKAKGSVFDEGRFDGILGLSFPGVSESEDSDPVFDSIIEKKLLEQNAFSFYYSLANGESSAVVFGPPAPELFVEPLMMVELSKEFYWEVHLVDVVLDYPSGKRKSLGWCSASKPCKLVIDTGTSMLTAPSSQVTDMLESLDVTAKCNSLEKLPTIVYVVQDKHGQQELTLEPSYYVLSYDDCSHEGSAKENCRSCEAGVMALDVQEPRGPLYILGDVFLRKYYTYFERGGTPGSSRIGFAVSKQTKELKPGMSVNDLI